MSKPAYGMMPTMQGVMPLQEDLLLGLYIYTYECVDECLGFGVHYPGCI